MTDQRISLILNRLLALLDRSLPSYLCHASPWSRRETEKGRGALEEIAQEQAELTGRVVEAIRRHKGQPDPGSFPMEFAAVHDLDAAYLIRLAIGCQRDDLIQIERAQAELGEETSAGRLVLDIATAARRHLELLEEVEPAGLAQSPATGSVGRQRGA